MNEQVQQQIVALVQAAMQGDQQARQQIQQIMQAAQQGDQQAIQIAQLIQSVVQQMQGQQVQSAKFGAKLNYIKHLRGQCPVGYEMGYYKAGGRLCKRCVKKHSDGDEMGPSGPIKNKTGQDAINEFRKHKPNKYPKSNGYQKVKGPDMEEMTSTPEGTYTTKEYNRRKITGTLNNEDAGKHIELPKKEKCGGKVKKNAVGGAVNSKEMPISCPCHKKKR